MRFDVKLSFNKKVLLRERKRHAARHITSTRCTDLSPWGGGGITYLEGVKGTYLGWGLYPSKVSTPYPIKSRYPLPQSKVGTPLKVGSPLPTVQGRYPSLIPSSKVGNAWYLPCTGGYLPT